MGILNFTGKIVSGDSGAYIYSFVITLCNFLGTCASKQSRLLIVGSQIPTISIVGPVTRTQKRSNELVIHEIDLAQPYFWRGNIGNFQNRLRHERPTFQLPK